MAYFKGNHSFKRQARASQRQGKDTGPFHKLLYFSLPEISGVSSVAPLLPMYQKSTMITSEIKYKEEGRDGKHS